MNRGHQFIAGIVALVVCSLCNASPAAMPATQAVIGRPTTRNAIEIAVDGHAELESAVQFLLREYAQHLRDPQSTVRSGSTYFQDRPAPDVSEQSITDQLRLKLNSDNRVDAYTKWQLLSGIASPAKPSIVIRLVAAYVSAPAPAVLPGVDAMSRQIFERERAVVIHEENVDDLDKEIRDRQGRMGQANQPIIAYRDELFARLPPTYDALAAGLQDLNVRLGAGADFESLQTHVMDGLAKLTNDPKATPAQLNALALALSKLSDAKVPYIAGAKWDPRKRQAKFEDKYFSLSDKEKLTEMVKDLRTAAVNRH